MADYTAGTIVYDPFGNPFVVKGVYYDATNTKYYYCEYANNYFLAQASQKCNTFTTDALGRQVTLPQPDCTCNGLLRLLPDTSLSLTVKPTKDNLFSPNR